LGLKTGQQAPPHKGAQDAPAQAGLHLAHCIRIHAGGRVQDDTRRAGLRSGLSVGITLALTRHFFKHAIDCANVKVQVFVQAGAKAVGEGDWANVQYFLV
jgi:hypothetical protein